MRISDWSSDVCSSDLTLERDPAAKAQQAACGIERRGGRRRLRASRPGRQIGRGGKMAQFVAQALGALPVVADVGEQALGALVVQPDAREVGSLKVAVHDRDVLGILDRMGTRLNSL